MTQSISRSHVQLFKILIITIILTSCSQNTHYAPVSDTGQPPSRQLSHHVVAKGETLYSIAWRYNLDFHKLARANGIGSDYRIYPGQKLALKESVTSPKPRSTPPPKVVKEPPKLVTKKKARSKNETRPHNRSLEEKKLSLPITWEWPAQGKLIAGFQSNKGLNKGIDIRGNLEEPVIAASSGIVVYAGDGLRGYGKLVIVKHSEKYLSAYAHNHRILVDEGDEVKQGQKIAAMGSSGTDSIKLHFEIRYDGKPVDPLKYLPKR